VLQLLLKVKLFHWRVWSLRGETIVCERRTALLNPSVAHPVDKLTG
jgi:hypothetical protein